MNYFELFGIKEAPVADKTLLALKYFELQKKYHPDFYTNENEADQENATMRSAAINKAFNIFRDPDKTLEYYLQLKGLITADEKYNLPPDFLVEMMEINESFDDEDKNALRARVAEYKNRLYAEIGHLMIAERPEPFSEQELQQLKSYFYRKKYLKRILERMDD